MAKRAALEEVGPEIYKKTRSSDRHPLVGKRIKIWFESDKCYYDAQVKSHKQDSSFEITWINEEADEVVELREADCTEDPANDDRWHVVAVVAKKDSVSEEAPEKDDGDEYRDEQMDKDEDSAEHVPDVQREEAQEERDRGRESEAQQIPQEQAQAQPSAEGGGEAV